MKEEQEEEIKNQEGAEDKQASTSASNRRVTLRAPRPLESGEVAEELFPFKRLYHWVPVQEDYEISKPDFSIIVTQEVLKRVNDHVAQDVNIEIGGFLLGNRYRCPKTDKSYIKIDNFSEAQFTSADDVSLHIDTKTWRQLNDELSGKYRGKKLMGWYHSHPGHTVFLSLMDLNVHAISFTEDWMVALVIDPQRITGGFFCKREGNMHPQAMVDFYEWKGLDSDETYLPWLNYQCFDSENDELLTPTLSPSMPRDEQLRQLPPSPEPTEVKEPDTPPVPEPTLWEKYRKQAIGLGVALLLVSATLLALKPDILSGNSENANANANTDVAANNATADAGNAAKVANSNQRVVSEDSNSQEAQVSESSSSVKPLAHHFVCKKDYDCSLKFFFLRSTSTNLALTMDEKKIPIDLKDEKGLKVVYLPIGQTQAVKVLKSSGKSGVGNLTLLFTNPDDPDNKQTYEVKLQEKDLLATTVRPPPPPVPKPPVQQPTPRRAQAAGRDGREVNNKTTIHGKKTVTQEGCIGPRC